MCGIVGVIGDQVAAPLLLEGLRRLEYRGYDSSGIATIHDNTIQRVRAEGKLFNLDKALHEKSISGATGIGHTRWATHGAPNERNAHPHATDKVAVVHNGIIENFQTLRKELTAKGYKFITDTDTEVVPILLTDFLTQGKTPQQAVSATLKKLEGAFALGIIFSEHPDLLIAARRGSPLAIGYGDGEMYLGSDAIALAPLTQRVAYLEDGDWAVLTRESAQVFDTHDQPAERAIRQTNLTGAAVGKGDYRHFMLKEIHEQPSVIGQTLRVFYQVNTGQIHLPELPFALEDISRITIVACGTSYYAGMVAKYWLEKYARLPVELDIASEFRYRDPVLEEGGLALFISQSGETADTLAAMHLCKKHNQHTLAIVNVPQSSMAMEADAALFTYAGPEIGVASTKAFTTQLTTLACFALAMARNRNTLSEETVARLSHAVAEVPAQVMDVLQQEDEFARAAVGIQYARDVLYLGRGTNYAIALEGALKLKEISYIHAEGYAAGELKHGPIALIDEDVPVIVIAPHDAWFEKTASNIQEVLARGGQVIAFTDRKGAEVLEETGATVIVLPEINSFVSPILYAIPIQLLAYHVAVLKGTDVDQPRNLAKSVTVE
ncbi:MAG: glutamine--fructose-6-phosphate transaminase (isomerizing) [Alphaproteobacteria bacterium]|nr:glutamine--fructose-6-phosphate transaminase (isomerizing) [Alphaproteobacteria bacterium]